MVTFAAELIDRSGTAPVIEAALAHATGRPRPPPRLCTVIQDEDDGVVHGEDVRA